MSHHLEFTIFTVKMEIVMQKMIVSINHNICQSNCNLLHLSYDAALTNTHLLIAELLQYAVQKGPFRCVQVWLRHFIFLTKHTSLPENMCTLGIL